MTPLARVLLRGYYGDTMTVKNIVLLNANIKYLIRGDSLFPVAHNPAYPPNWHNFSMKYKSSSFEIELDRFAFPQ